MLLCRMIAPDWLVKRGKKHVIEKQFSNEEIESLNKEGYNVYWFPNGPTEYNTNSVVDSKCIDDFNYVFVDMDTKMGVYKDKMDFVSRLNSFLPPTFIVDSGNGVHAYWEITDLDVQSYLYLSRRLMRFFNTDPATQKICQLMRWPGTFNTKNETDFKKCEIIEQSGKAYTAETLHNLLPNITPEDEEYCKNHYDSVFNPEEFKNIDDSMPAKFTELLEKNIFARNIWNGPSKDRSADDWQLANIMYKEGFTETDGVRVLLNTQKALSRYKAHRYTYANNIVKKIWVQEQQDEVISSSVTELLQQRNSVTKGSRLKCHPMVDNTVEGFRRGHVMGLVAGSGVGKTAFSLNIFKWFIELNPDCHHFFIPLEQPSHEIADRWCRMVGDDAELNSRVHVISNYTKSGNFRNLGLKDIEKYLLEWKTKNNKQIGCIVIDHIGVLKKAGRSELDGIIGVCHDMKPFAQKLNAFLIMQSQTTREKAGIGDLELDKDAAYGSVMFESYCDYLVTMWQPLKRAHYDEACPTVTAFKFCKIRHQNAKKDKIKEQVPYYCYFDTNNEKLREMSEDEKTSFQYFLPRVISNRTRDRQRDIVEYADAIKD